MRRGAPHLDLLRDGELHREGELVGLVRVLGHVERVEPPKEHPAIEGHLDIALQSHTTERVVDRCVAVEQRQHIEVGIVGQRLLPSPPVGWVRDVRQARVETHERTRGVLKGDALGVVPPMLLHEPAPRLDPFDLPLVLHVHRAWVHMEDQLDPVRQEAGRLVGSENVKDDGADPTARSLVVGAAKGVLENGAWLSHGPTLPPVRWHRLLRGVECPTAEAPFGRPRRPCPSPRR